MLLIRIKSVKYLKHKWKPRTSYNNKIRENTQFYFSNTSKANGCNDVSQWWKDETPSGFTEANRSERSMSSKVLR